MVLSFLYGGGECNDWTEGSVEIVKIQNFEIAIGFFIALGGEDQNGIFFLDLVSHLAGWNFI